VTQIAAAKAALCRVVEEILRDHAADCVEHAINSGNKSDQRHEIAERVDVIGRAGREAAASAPGSAAQREERCAASGTRGCPFAWLMRGGGGASNPSDPAMPTLKVAAYRIPQRQPTGETMTTQTIRDAANLASARAEAVQDLLLVSSFGVWAMLLGVAPVVALRLMTGS
jgi:hypothetical protein